MSKKKTLLSAILAIAFCMSLIAGSTFALFTSESKVNIAVQSGKVEVVASVEGMNTYSVVNDDAISEEADDYAGTIAENKLGAGKYKYVLQDPGKFSEGGTAVYNNDDGKLTLNKMIPGDKVTFNVNIANNSTVNIKYRVIVQVENGLKLFTALKVKIDGTSFTGVKRTGAWTSLAATAGVDAIADIPVEIYMPVETSNEYQDLSTSMYISIEAVQGNAKTVDGTLTAEVAAVAEDKTKVNTTTKETVAATTISDNDDLVTVSIPSGTKLTSTAAADENDELSLAVKVKPQDTSGATLGNITVTSAQASASYDVSVLLVVNNEVTDQKAVNNADNDEEITVSMFIGAGLMGVQLWHTDDEGNTTAVNFDEYNSETGYITFKTKSFSEYTVVYNADYAKETFDEEGNSTGIVVYEATETAGVYTTKDENQNEVYVTVTTDETTGEATEQVSDSMLVTGDDGVVFEKYIDGDLYIYDMSGFKGAEYTVPENVNGFGGGSFSGNTTIKTLTLTKQLDSAYKALQGNSSITTVNFGAMTSIPNRMFYGCTGIKQIEIPATVNRIEDYAFYGNGSIETIVAKDLVYVGYKAFDACSALKVLDIGGENVAIMGWAGRQVKSIETIIIRGANATVNLDYAPAGESKGAFVFDKTQQSGNPDTMPGVDLYVANDAVAAQFNAEINIEGATRKAIVNVSNAEELNAALANGDLAKFTNNISVEASIVAPYGNKLGILQANGGVIDGNGYTLSVTGGGDTYAIMTKGGVIENLRIDNGFRGVMIMSAQRNVYLFNVTSGGSAGVIYTMNTGEGGKADVRVLAYGCSFLGWTSFALIKDVTFTNCYFAYSNYNVVRPYVNTTFDCCSFEHKFYIDFSALGENQTVKLNNCTANDKTLNAENVAIYYDDSTTTETVFIELPEGRTLEECATFA